MTDPKLDRRTVLRGLACLPFARLAGAAHAAAPGGRSLILVWLDGGMSHVDTFDGKPEAPATVRGDLPVVRGSVEGTFVSGHLPEIGRRLDRCALIRSVTHGEGNHDRGTHTLLTGVRPSPVLVHPSLGSVASARLPQDGPLPAYVAVPDLPAYGGAGFLEARHGAFAVGGEPGRPGFRVENLDPAPAARERRELVGLLDRLDGVPRSESEAARDHFAAQAVALSQDPRWREPFDLAREGAEVRQRYGPHRLGQSLLLARRLAAAGVRVVLVRDVGWDHHQGIARALTYGFPPPLAALDQALSALLDDLRRLELDERIAVCVASEFGRTPRLNPSGGRDHWPRAQSVLFAGGGLRRGVVVGETDRSGEEPIARPVAPAELFATWCRLLGVPVEEPLRTPDGRPIALVPHGVAPVHEVLA